MNKKSLNAENHPPAGFSLFKKEALLSVFKCILANI